MKKIDTSQVTGQRVRGQVTGSDEGRGSYPGGEIAQTGCKILRKCMTVIRRMADCVARCEDMGNECDGKHHTSGGVGNVVGLWARAIISLGDSPGGHFSQAPIFFENPPTQTPPPRGCQPSAHPPKNQQNPAKIGSNIFGLAFDQAPWHRGEGGGQGPQSTYPLSKPPPRGTGVQ